MKPIGVNEIKKKVTIVGIKVQDVDYRLFLLDKAEKEYIRLFEANNIDKKEGEKEQVEILMGDSEDKIERFIEFIRIDHPKQAIVDDVQKVEDYEGDIMHRESFTKIFHISQLSKFSNIGNKYAELYKKQNAELMELVNKQMAEHTELDKVQIRDYNIKRLKDFYYPIQNIINTIDETNPEYLDNIGEYIENILYEKNVIFNAYLASKQLRELIKDFHNKYYMFQNPEESESQNKCYDDFYKIIFDIKRLVNEETERYEKDIENGQTDRNEKK